MNEQKIKEVFSDKEYVKSLFAMQSYEEVQKSLEEKEIELSVEEIRKIHSLILKKANGELTDKDLEEVAGGLGVLTAILIATVSGTIVATGASHTYHYLKDKGC